MNEKIRDISVVVTYHNREQYIDEAIKSVLAQTLKPLEIIVVNDGSTVAARRHLERWQNDCTIVDLLRQSGPSAARNEGVRHARGTFVAFLDDDDIWLPHKLDIQRRFLEEHPECSAVHGAAWFFFSHRPEWYYKGFAPGPMTLAQALTDEYWVMTPTLFARREMLAAMGGYDVGFREAEDRDLIIRCCAAGHRIEGIPEPLARVRRQGHPSLTRRRWRVFRTDLRMCWKHRALYLRAYGPRGVLSFVLEKVQLPSRQTRYVDGAVRRLLRYVPVKYEIRPTYREPVLESRPFAFAPCPPHPPELLNENQA